MIAITQSIFDSQESYFEAGEPKTEIVRTDFWRSEKNIVIVRAAAGGIAPQQST